MDMQKNIHAVAAARALISHKAYLAAKDACEVLNRTSDEAAAAATKKAEAMAAAEKEHGADSPEALVARTNYEEARNFSSSSHGALIAGTAELRLLKCRADEMDERLTATVVTLSAIRDSAAQLQIALNAAASGGEQ